jgi:imidazole glycerol-phosphate synthase subunit HisF
MPVRIIARLDVKPPNVVKPVHFEGLRKIGTPQDLALAYHRQGADEILYLDIVASLYEREILMEQIRETARSIFIPFGAGGGVRTVQDFAQLIHNGVDKVIVNTFALQKDPTLIDRAARAFGSQAVVVHVEAKRWNGWWECYSDCGRIRSGRDVLSWVEEVEQRGAGEVMVSSVDRDGRRRGFDVELIQEVTSRTTIPVIAASGAGSLEHIREVIQEARPDAVAIASLLHYGTATIGEIKEFLDGHGIPVAR